MTCEKVTFANKLGMKVVGNLFVPKSLNRGTPSPAIIVGHPMGAVKEQSANLYATKLAERGFVTLSFDLSFWGESEGQPRQTVAPDIYVDDFSAAVDFLSTQPIVNKDSIGVLGICGSGSFALSAAQIDPRMKAIATVSMYDMGAANRDGLRKGVTPRAAQGRPEGGRRAALCRVHRGQAQVYWRHAGDDQRRTRRRSSESFTISTARRGAPTPAPRHSRH